MRSRKPIVAALLLATLTASAGTAEPPAALAEGVKLFEAGDHGAAMEFFSAVDDAVEPGWLAYYQGRIHLAAGEHDAAIERLTAATEADAGSSLFRRWLGEAYVEKLDTVGMLKKMPLAQKAKASFEEAVRLAPDDPEARDALAGYYLNAPAIAGGSREKALEQATALIELDAARGNSLLGRIHLDAQEWEPAVAAYEAAIAAAPDEARYRYQLGFVLQQSEDWPGAFAAFERAIEVDPAWMASYYQLGRTAIFSKTNLDRAVECMRHYLAQERQPGMPEHQHAHWRLGMLLELKGKMELAAEEYRQALALDPEHEEASKALARLQG